MILKYVESMNTKLATVTKDISSLKTLIEFVVKAVQLPNANDAPDVSNESAASGEDMNTSDLLN